MKEKEQNRRPIGVFDSGIGGLTVVRQLQRVLPREDIVYLGDTARVPYGSKSPETVIRFAVEDSQFLMQEQVKAIVVACNTASAWALGRLQERFPVPIFGVILPGAQAALESSVNRRIGVIGTSATERSQAYAKCIVAQETQAKVFTRACPLLVPLVEEGWLTHPVTRAVLGVYLTPLRLQRIDTLVLGCTHYPLLKPAIRRIMGGRVRLIDSAESCAAYVEQGLAKRNLLRPSARRPGSIRAFVTDEVQRFEDLAKRFLGDSISAPRKVQLPSVG